MIVGIEPTVKSSSSVQFVQPDGSVWLSKSLGSFSSIRNGLRIVFKFGVQFRFGSIPICNHCYLTGQHQCPHISILFGPNEFNF